MTGNMMQEVNRAQQVARLGLSTVGDAISPDPPTPFVIPSPDSILADITNAVLR